MSEKNAFAIATRRSPLALAQARMVQLMIAKAVGHDPNTANSDAPIRDFVSSGDQNLAGSLAEIGGKGLFTKEIEDALLSGEARFAVHSMKDMPAESPPGLITAAIPHREDPRDVFISPNSITPWTLADGAAIGTASVRRLAQTLSRRPDLKPVTLRGNVGTRLSKLERGEADATFLALAGLRRLGLEQHATYILPPEEMLPAVGQGALCVQTREDDEEARAIAAKFNCAETEGCVAVERAFLAGLDGSCRTPIAGLAVIENGEVWFRGELLSLDGATQFKIERKFPYTANNVQQAVEIGAAAAIEIRERAGNKFFAALTHEGSRG